MPVAEQIVALFAALTREEVNAMVPAKRRRFADMCRHWAGLADGAPAVAFRSGAGEHAQAGAAPVGQK
jgi:hypothetical protein